MNKKEEELNYEEDMEIDVSALDVEWLVTQGKLAIKYNDHYIKCRKRFVLAHEDVKIIRSELIRRANKHPERCCFKKKPNKDDIEAYYRNHQKYKKAKNTMIDLEDEKVSAELAKNEINFTRKAALENAGELLAQNYFAGPRMPRDIHKESTRKRKELNHKNQSKISTGMKRKKKRS